MQPRETKLENYLFISVAVSCYPMVRHLIIFSLSAFLSFITCMQSKQLSFVRYSRKCPGFTSLGCDLNEVEPVLQVLKVVLFGCVFDFLAHLWSSFGEQW